MFNFFRRNRSAESAKERAIKRLHEGHKQLDLDRTRDALARAKNRLDVAERPGK